MDTKLAQIYEVVREELQLVENYLVKQSEPEFPFVAHGISELLNGGKRLRPASLLISAKLSGTSVVSPVQGNYSGQRSIDLAVAVELLHAASLIHDDIVDDAPVRRGRETINSKWGNRISVLAGDHLYSKAISIFTNDHDFRVIQTIAYTTAQMVRGEITEQLRQKDTTISEQEYLSIINNKTASLIAACCRVGSMIGEPSTLELEALTNYGTNLGIAFQITDDLLDISGVTKKLGKPLGSDIRGGRITLPFIYTFRNAKKAEREELNFGFKNQELEIIDRLFKKYKAIEYSFEKAKEYMDMSKGKLKPFKHSKSKDALIALADYVVGRSC